ncbi:MAG: adenine deaminase [Bacteroidia bacterium]|nr:adenine deaminase [Bacteroidia bacterium]
MNSPQTITGNVVDVITQTITPAQVTFDKGIITAITPTTELCSKYILPGFIDAHIHIESSMLVPSEFARLALPHGTIGTISDPHEIANVCGVDGVKYMIDNGNKVPFYFYFGAPSCVPATPFETAGATINSTDIHAMLQWDGIYYLSEMMNYPGVLNADEEVMRKIASAKQLNKPIDGHLPGIMGNDTIAYINAGISTDHECFTYAEALHKIQHGMKVLIREGSAAKNFDALIPLLDEYPHMIMFCSDDKHPNELMRGHLNEIAARAVAFGCNVMNVMRALTHNVKQHYNLPHGMLQVGDSADFITVDNLTNFNVSSTFIKGIKVAQDGKALFSTVKEKEINQFNINAITIADIQLNISTDTRVNVIVPKDGQLVTTATQATIHASTQNNVAEDVLKIVVVNRYNKAPPAIAYIKNIGLKTAAIASTVAHDSHNIVACGSSDEFILQAINELIHCKGGISYADVDGVKSLALPVGGLMSTDDGYVIGALYEALDELAKQAGSTLRAPYMTLSFMALLVIPALKLSDKGLFDGTEFKFTNLITS